jgi:KDO2-lipid IV(A) lauroyltransferase
LFEILALKKIDKKYIEKYIRIEGRHFIDEALSRNKGLIFVTLHLGNWEISNAACGLFYQPYNVIVKEQKHGRLNSLLDSYRKSFGVNTVGVNSLKDIIRALENNEIVSIVSDHGAGESDALIEFFGRKALMPQGAVRLAAKFKAPLIFAYIARISGPYQKIVLEPFNSFVDTGDKEKYLEGNLREIN